MRWTYRSRQGWLVIGTGLVLLGGSDRRHAGQVVSAAIDSAQTAAAPGWLAVRQGLAGVRSLVDGMPLAAGGDAPDMPIVLPEEAVAPMPGR